MTKKTNLDDTMRRIVREIEPRLFVTRYCILSGRGHIYYQLYKCPTLLTDTHLCVTRDIRDPIYKWGSYTSKISPSFKEITESELGKSILLQEFSWLRFKLEGVPIAFY